MAGKKFVPSQMDICIGEMINLMRNKLGMSQQDLATHLGVTFQQVQKYESAGNRISASRLHQIADVFQVPVARFFNEIDNGLLIDDAVRKMLKQFLALGTDDRRYILKLIQRLAHSA